MKKFIALLCFGLFSFAADCLSAEWLTDYQAARKQAAAEDKGILINFTGSDWCGWCIKLKREVFDQPEFAAFAAENLVLLEVDFPRKKPQSQQLRVANDKLAKQFAVTGYPTIYLLDKNGKNLGKAGYAPGGPANYIRGLKQVKGINWRASQATEEAAQPAPAPAPAVKKVDPLSIRPAEIKYGDLQLKGISGGSQKFALINNKSFAAGENGKVKTGDKQVVIECKEIRADSVVIQVEGEAQPRELMLKK